MGNKQYIDKENCYEIKVEFMTKKQKQKKDEILANFEEVKLVDDFEIYLNKEDQYDVDFRDSIFVPKNLSEIEVDFVIKHLYGDQFQKTKDDFEYPELNEFVKTKVKKIICILLNNRIITDRKQKLYMSQCLHTTPVFEIIYEKNSFFEALGKQAVYKIKKFRKNFMKDITDFLGLTCLVESIQSGSRFGMVSSLFSKKILQFAGKSVFGDNIGLGVFFSILRLFFPFVTPILFLLRLN
ncbi:transmembrane protein, putative (macronuclear) [Tetrahymena thermophila SB210]|uniref:Transmembrane protein, putative n=1 Tax=Tetrahymena thermophila (strain SB210) TaxID=312017 RepID=I7LT97_TETTS|nr:transmembrane protein, putative [Tetrahymena thermophila SB210]EAR84849.2 transmembrane protein, putative [Tetrahymena thermophila SB210]|eukprot:XP_001032512.2 transmembrane protein, putative [Tetrahymena thermophila SB210]